MQLYARGINLYSKTRSGIVPFDKVCMAGTYPMIKYILSIMDKTKVCTENMLHHLKYNDKLYFSEKNEKKN